MKFIEESTNSNILNILFLSFIPLTFFVRDVGNICLIALLLFSVYHIVFKEFRLDEQEIFILISILFFTLCIVFLSIYHLAPMHEIDHYLRAILLFPIFRHSLIANSMSPKLDIPAEKIIGKYVNKGKIFGNTELDSKVVVKGINVTKGAKKSIEDAGGRIIETIATEENKQTKEETK